MKDSSKKMLLGAEIIGGLGLAISVGYALVRIGRKKEKRCAEKEMRKIKKEYQEIIEEVETEGMIKARILKGIKNQVKGKISGKEILKVIVPEIIEKLEPKNRAEFKSACINIIVETVPLARIKEVPKNIEELEDLMRESGTYETYENYLEQIYSRK